MNELKSQRELASNEIVVRTILDTNETHVQQRGVKSLKVGDLRVLVKWKTQEQLALTGKKKYTRVEPWNNSSAEQGAAALLWSAADEPIL